MKDRAGIILTLGEKMLFVINGKHRFKQSYNHRFSIPKGSIKKGESPWEAAVRELREEAGVDMQKLGFDEEDCDDQGVLQISRRNQLIKLYFYVFHLDYLYLNSLMMNHDEIAGFGFFGRDMAVNLAKENQILFVEKYLLGDEDQEEIDET